MNDLNAADSAGRTLIDDKCSRMGTGLQDAVVRRAGPDRCRIGNHVGLQLEISAVIGHESHPTRRARAELAHLAHTGRFEDLGELCHRFIMAESLNRGELGQYDECMLVWMDLEMTGLDHTSDVIVEIATLITDDQLEIVAEGPDLVIHATDEQLACDGPVCR